MRTSLYALCYPTLSSDDMAFIDAYRERFDLPFKDVVKPHFTIAFGIDDISLDEYAEHLQERLSQQKKVNFHCRYAMLGSHHASGDFYVYLVPDEGYSDISLLHDKVYSGRFEKYHKHNIPYIPHIGIATLKNSQEIKSLCSKLNDRGLEIEGSLESMTIAQYDGEIITDIKNIPFN